MTILIYKFFAIIATQNITDICKTDYLLNGLNNMQVSLEQFQAEIQKDPIYFWDSVLGCTHWSAQE